MTLSFTGHYLLCVSDGYEYLQTFVAGVKLIAWAALSVGYEGTKYRHFLP